MHHHLLILCSAFLSSLLLLQLALYFSLEMEFPEENSIIEVRQRRANAAVVILCRNSDLADLVNTLTQFEETFNAKYNYPYVFLNDQPFTDQFKQQIFSHLQSSSAAASRKIIKFGLVPKEHWSYPDWIDQDKAAEVRRQMKEAKVSYGDLESYHHMCRYFSGFFYRHPLLLEYDYYWRVEPGAEFYCQAFQDPFLYMMNNKIEYAFYALQPEIKETIPTLWNTTKDFLKNVYPKLRTSNNDKMPSYQLLKLLLNSYYDEELFKDADFSDGLENLSDKFYYPGCHFWSNFEIASFAFFRSERYQSYFDYLDKSGGFFYERWGDAPVHSLGIAMFLEPSQVHHFDDIGYQHGHALWCPDKRKSRFSFPCKCKHDVFLNLDYNNFTCDIQFRVGHALLTGKKTLH